MVHEFLINSTVSCVVGIKSNNLVWFIVSYEMVHEFLIKSTVGCVVYVKSSKLAWFVVRGENREKADKFSINSIVNCVLVQNLII